MPTPVERVMQTYGLMVSLTPEQQDEARDRLEHFLESQTGSEHELAVLGLQFLRGNKKVKPRWAQTTLGDQTGTP
jgi:hypothetical protein